jgi:hypothetical protein
LLRITTLRHDTQHASSLCTGVTTGLHVPQQGGSRSWTSPEASLLPPRFADPGMRGVAIGAAHNSGAVPCCAVLCGGSERMYGESLVTLARASGRRSCRGCSCRWRSELVCCLLFVVGERGACAVPGCVTPGALLSAALLLLHRKSAIPKLGHRLRDCTRAPNSRKFSSYAIGET